MHKLLARQIRKVQAASADGSLDVDKLLAMVDLAYDEADRERRIKDHAFEEMQREVDILERRTREDAEARFNVVMDNVGEAVLIIDERGRVESFNAAAERIFGFTPDEVIGRNVAMLMTAADASHHDATLANYLRTGEKKIVGIGRETVAQRKNGEAFPIELAVGDVTTGARRRFIGVIRDISLRKQAERELRESESRFRDLAGSASDWFWETDADDRIIFVSERIGAVLGVKPAEVLGTTFFDLGLGDDPVAAAEHRADIDAHRPFRERTFHVGPPEGRDSRDIRISGIPVFGDDGEFYGYRGLGLDITREVAAEARARNAQQLLADAIERVVEGLAIYDANDCLVVSNPEYRRVFSQLNHAILPGTLFETVLRANPSAFDTEGQKFEDWAQTRLARHREASGQPFLIRMSDGRWIMNREYRMADGGTVGLRTDITEMKQREQELEALKQRYKLILDSAGEGIIGLDIRGQITFANRGAGAMLGHVPDDMVGKSFAELVQTQPISPVGNAYHCGVATQANEEYFRRADGSHLPVDLFAAPLNEDDAVAGAVVVFRDATLRIQYERALADNQRELERQVSERTQALSMEVETRARTEAALRASRERLRGITDGLVEGVLVVHRNGRVAFANPSAIRLLDCHREPEGHPIDTLFHLGGEREIWFETSPWRQIAQEGGTVRDDDAVFLTAGGRKLAVAYACSSVVGEGEGHGAVISFRDIEALKAAQREALQASRMASVGQLAAGIAHEINTPIQYVGDNLRFIGTAFRDLTQVLDAASLLSEQCVAAGLVGPAAAFADAAASADLPYLREEIPSAVQQSLDGVAQVARIVLSMKEFSHPGTRAKSMADINWAIDTTLTVSRNTWKHVAEVERDFDLNLPMVPCHVGELNQVFLNLVVNAVHAIEKAGKDGLGHIRISTARDGDEVVIRFEDSGTGVPEVLRERIFDPFFTTKDVGKGTGQGLAICRNVVVAKHGGRLDVGGREGEGAVFSIRLPLHGTADTENLTEEEDA